MSIACGITKDFTGIEIRIYNVTTKQPDYFKVMGKSIHETIDELIAQYGNDIGIIVVGNSSYLTSDEFENSKQDYLKKYGSLIYHATKEELDFQYYLTSKVKYSIGDLIIKFDSITINLYECTEVTGEKVTWKELDSRDHGFTVNFDFEFVERMFRLKMDQIHAVFESSQSNINSLNRSELDEYNFKSIHFITKTGWPFSESDLARYLISDSEVSVLVKIDKSFKISTFKTYTIQDWGFIHVPKLVKEYQSKTDIMGIDLGSTRTVLAVSRNKDIHVIPVDKSSPGDLWTEFVVSFDEDTPIIGKAAMRRLKTKPDYVIFDAKLLCSKNHRKNVSKQSIWPFKFYIKEDEEPHLESMTSESLKEFTLAEINAIFLERMAKAASGYQDVFNNGNSVTKAVITVPRYFEYRTLVAPFISSVIEAAKLANIEIIDIIEETHADLLYYLSHEKYSKMIKPGMKIVIYDIGGGTYVRRDYEISYHKEKMYATCFGELYSKYDAKCSGRAIDSIIIKELEKSIPESLRSYLKQRTLEAAKKIKYDLSFEEEIKFDLSEIYRRLEGTVEFTREWFEGELKSCFEYKKDYYTLEQYSLPTQRALRCRRTEENETHSSRYDINIVFLAGGTCRIPFIQKWISRSFPNAKIIIDGQLEIITATGAVVHALQVLNKEVEPYVTIQNSNDSQETTDSEIIESIPRKQMCQIL